MKRNEAHEKLHFGNKLGYLDFNELHIGIEEIYDDFEKEIYHRDKTIELLNEEMLKLRIEIEELKR